MSENELSSRLKFLIEKDVEKLQEEFLKTKNQNSLSVKNINKENKINPAENDVNNLILNNNVSDKKLKKKKDIITLDINIVDVKNTSVSNQNISQSYQSIFKQEKEKINLIKKDNNINKETGLPDTFKIDFKNKDKKKISIDISKEGRIEYLKNSKEEIIKKISNLKIQNDEYKQIHIKNLELIKNMNKEELIEYNETIKSKIPQKLLDKMKKGFFQKKLVDEKIDINDITDINKKDIINEDLNDSEEEIQIENKTKVNDINKTSKILINYQGVIKYDQIYQTNQNKNSVDYSQLNYKEIDLENKFFSLEEIKNLLMSTNEQQVAIGLKLSSFIINDQNLLFNDEVTKNKFWNIFYFLIDHRNINIKMASLNNLVLLLNNLFLSDYKNFKQSIFYFNNFPCFKINETFSVKDDNNNLKIEILSIFNNEENIHKNNILLKTFLNLIITKEGYKSQDNYVMNLLNFIFYSFYLNNNENLIFKNSEVEMNIKNLISNFKSIFDSKFNQNNFYKFKKIFSNILTTILLDPKFELFNMIENSEFNLDNKLNFVKLIKTGKINEDKFENISKMKIIDINLLMKFINEKTLNENDNIKNYKFINDLNINLMENFSNKNLILLSRSILTKIKIFKYSLISEDFDYYIISDKEDIKNLENLLTKCLDYLNKILNENENIMEQQLLNFNEINPIYEFINTIFIFYLTSIKYQKSIKHSKTIDINNSFIEIINKLNNFYLKIILSIGDNENKKFQFLYLLENYTKLNLNILKYSKFYYKSNTDNLIANILLILPNFFNTNSESYYYKFLKYLNYHFNRKIKENKSIQNFITKINFSFDILMEDLNLYLNSNEDLRRSNYYKKNMLLDENLKEILFQQNNFIKSKFLPFNKNFILQILFNDKINSEVKLNYLVLLMIICQNENISQNFNFLEIIFKTLLKFKDVINENKSEFVFSEFIKNLLLKNENYKNLYLDKNRDTDIFIEMFYTKFEYESLNEKEVAFNYKFLILFILMIHNPKTKNNREQFYKLNVDSLSLLFYSYFLPITEKMSKLHFIDEKNSEKIINFISENLSYDYMDFYITLIMTYLRNYLQNRQEILKYKNESIMIKLIEKLILNFEINLNLENENEVKEFYYKNIEDDNKEIRERIYENLINK